MALLLIEKKRQTAIVTLNRPEALNALNQELYKELADAFEEIRKDDNIRAVILTGSGNKAFAAGADIAAMRTMTAVDARALAQVGQKPLDLIAQLPQPVIAAVNGLALGGGCELAMACDLRIASTTAKFGQPEINLAVIPGGGGTQRLPRLVGVAIAKELIFSGRIISADDALRIGLVNKVVSLEALMPTAEELAEELSRKPAVALALAKNAINKSMEAPLQMGLDHEIVCFASCFATEDQKEGMGAFVEKRQPQFKGR